MDDGDKYQVFLAESGQEAIEIIKTQHMAQNAIDVVISDSHMPVVNGFQLFQKLALYDHKPSFILTSAFATDASVRKAKAEGIAAVVEKPVRKEDLERLIDQAIEAQHQKKILLVDDHALLAKTYAEALRQAGHFVFYAVSGEKALQMARKFYYDLYFIDLNLPDLSGIELMRNIKQLRPDAMVISLSGEASVREREQLKILGVYDHLEKPMSQRRLRHMTDIYVQKLASYRRGVHEAIARKERKTIWQVLREAVDEIIRILKTT